MNGMSSATGSSSPSSPPTTRSTGSAKRTAKPAARPTAVLRSAADSDGDDGSARAAPDDLFLEAAPLAPRRRISRDRRTAPLLLGGRLRAGDDVFLLADTVLPQPSGHHRLACPPGRRRAPGPDRARHGRRRAPPGPGR